MQADHVGIVAGTAIQSIVAGTAVNVIDPVAASKDVVAILPVEIVVAIIAEDEVVAAYASGGGEDVCIASFEGSLLTFGVWEVDMSGVLAAAVASGAAWLGTRRHSTLATSYSMAARELALVRVKLLDADGASWADAVAEAEKSMGREHRLWLASRPVES